MSDEVDIGLAYLEMAEAALGVPKGYSGPLSHLLPTEAVARAIQSAVIAERSACADAAFRAAQHVNKTADDVYDAVMSGDR